MKRLYIALGCLILCAGMAFAQKGSADPDYYPLGYSGDTWTGEVTAFDNERRTLTLTHGSGDKAVTFVASIPDAPFEWRRDGRNFRVVDFPFDKKSEYQTYRFMGPGKAGTIAPEGAGSGNKRLPSPPASNVISEFGEFKGRHITVYYTVRERKTDGGTEKYNDVWRIRILDTKKK